MVCLKTWRPGDFYLELIVNYFLIVDSLKHAVHIPSDDLDEEVERAGQTVG